MMGIERFLAKELAGLEQLIINYALEFYEKIENKKGKRNRKEYDQDTIRLKLYERFPEVVEPIKAAQSHDHKKNQIEFYLLVAYNQLVIAIKALGLCEYESCMKSLLKATMCYGALGATFSRQVGVSKAMVAVRHEDNHNDKRYVREWYEAHKHEFTLKQDAITHIFKSIVPGIKESTIKTYLKGLKHPKSSLLVDGLPTQV